MVLEGVIWPVERLEGSWVLEGVIWLVERLKGWRVVGC